MVKTKKEKVFEKTINFAGRPLTLKSGEFAPQAHGAVLAQYGETMVLATAVYQEPTEKPDFFPLRVDYEERLYAGGRIKGSRFVKREGRPSDEAILTARLIDRSIRPLFPKDFFHEVQIIVTVLSVEPNADPAILGLIATSAALSISPIPWAGPIAAVRIGMNNGSFILNPLESERDFSKLDLVLSCRREDILMIETQAEEIPEKEIVQALQFGFEQSQKVIDLIEELTTACGQEKLIYARQEIDPELKQNLQSFLEQNFNSDLWSEDKEKRENASNELLENLYQEFEGRLSKSEMRDFFIKYWSRRWRERVINEGKRFGDRGVKEIRPLKMKVGLLPRTHGSALFQRGQTQVLTVTTLASTSLEQLIETISGEETKRYIHHYNFFPFSTGEIRRLGSPGRREIGHGALAEKALLPVIPSEEDFPYTIRVVSEILSSDGSTSQASVCGSSLSLMDAGVPIKTPIAGVALGLIKEGEKEVVLTDIAGVEDMLGDMDFKVAGSREGVTAIQLDVKKPGLTLSLLEKALAQAHEGRLFILQEMEKVLSEPRQNLSKYAPHIISVEVDPSQIGKIIGPGGSMVRRIQEETGTTIDIRDEGRVIIAGSEQEGVEKAARWIQGIGREVREGQIYDGVVTQVVDFGAFVEIFPGKEGLLHISQIGPGYIKRIRDFINEGDQIKVKVLAVDAKGRVNLTRADRDQQ